MKAIVAPQGRDHWDKMGMPATLEALRSQAGESMVLQNDRLRPPSTARQ
jgi:haloalkane dehalogenase